MRLIDADALWMDIIHSMDYCDDFLEFIENAPTVDAVEVVRCKDCDNYEGDGMYCAWDILTGDMGYCHHARPKGGTDITDEQTDVPVITEADWKRIKAAYPESAMILIDDEGNVFKPQEREGE